MTEHVMRVDDGGGREKKVVVDYPSNSKLVKDPPVQERPKIEAVVSGTVVRRKQGLLHKLFGNFIAEDADTVMNYVFMDVLLPAAKNAFSDAISQGIERMLFGEQRSRATPTRTGYTNYAQRFTQPKVADRQPMSRQARASHNFSDIILETRVDAEEVLDLLRNLITTYGSANVNEFYDLVGITGEFTDDKYGWDDLRSAYIKPVRGGYMFNLPRPQPLVT